MSNGEEVGLNKSELLPTPSFSNMLFQTASVCHHVSNYAFYLVCIIIFSMTILVFLLDVRKINK